MGKTAQKTQKNRAAQLKVIVDGSGLIFYCVLLNIRWMDLNYNPTSTHHDPTESGQKRARLERSYSVGRTLDGATRSQEVQGRPEFLRKPEAIQVLVSWMVYA